MERRAGPCRDRRVARPAPDLLHPALQDAALADDRQRRRRPVPGHGPRRPPGRRLGLLPELLALGHVPHAGDAARAPAARARAGHRALDVPAPRRGGWLPRWSLGALETNIMAGDPVTPWLAENFALGTVPDDIADELWDYLVENATTTPPDGVASVGRRSTEFYAEHGHVPFYPENEGGLGASSRSTATAAPRRSSSRSPTRASAPRPSGPAARVVRRSSTGAATGGTCGTRTSRSPAASRAWSTRSARPASSSRCPS